MAGRPRRQHSDAPGDVLAHRRQVLILIAGKCRPRRIKRRPGVQILRWSRRQLRGVRPHEDRLPVPVPARTWSHAERAARPQFNSHESCGSGSAGGWPRSTAEHGSAFEPAIAGGPGGPPVGDDGESERAQHGVEAIVGRCHPERRRPCLAEVGDVGLDEVNVGPCTAVNPRVLGTLGGSK